MNIKTDERHLGFNQYGITAKEAKILCGKLPKDGREKLVNNDDGNHYWVGRVWFQRDYSWRPFKWTFYATLTNWKIYNGQAILLASNT